MAMVVIIVLETFSLVRDMAGLVSELCDYFCQAFHFRSWCYLRICKFNIQSLTSYRSLKNPDEHSNSNYQKFITIDSKVTNVNQH